MRALRSTPPRNLPRTARIGAFVRASWPAMFALLSLAATRLVHAQAPGSEEALDRTAADASEVDRANDETNPSELFERARAAEDEGNVAQALEGYRAVVREHPSSRLAQRAEQRLAWLEARTDDPDALARWLVHRARTRRDRASTEAFEAEALAMRPGLVRREALAAVAADFDALAAQHQADASLAARAEDAYLRILADSELDATMRAQLVASYANLLGRIGRTGEALMVLERAGHETGSLRRRLELQRFDGWARPLALSVLAALALAAVGSAVRALRSDAARAFASPRVWATPLATVLYGGLGPALLGAAYSVEAGHLTERLAVALVPSLGLAAVLGRATSVQPVSERAHAALVILAALGPIAAGYLAIQGTGDGPLTH